jgi:perosamine synthetase
MCGSFGDVSTFSFYVNKHITTGEGGMIVANKKKIYQRLLKLKNLYFGKGTNRFKHKEKGWNCRLTNLQAAIGLAQLEKIKKIVKKKFFIGNYYRKNLLNLSNKIILPLESNSYCKNIYWVYGLIIKDKINIKADKIIDILKRKGVECRPFFYPMHKQPVFKKIGIFKKEYYPISEKLSAKGFYIPSGIGMTINEQDKVINVLYKVFKNLN